MLPSMIHLEKLSLVHCWLGTQESPPIQAGLLCHSTVLRSVRLHLFNTASALRSFLNNLPASVTTLDTEDFELYTNEDFHACLAQFLERHGSGLVQLALRDSILHAAPEHRHLPRLHAYDNVLAGLSGLRQLHLNPCGVSSLATFLGPLPQLELITLAMGEVAPEDKLQAAELGSLLERSSSLREVRVANAVWRGWSISERAALCHSARTEQAVRFLNFDLDAELDADENPDSDASSSA